MVSCLEYLTILLYTNKNNAIFILMMITNIKGLILHVLFPFKAEFYEY